MLRLERLTERSANAKLNQHEAELKRLVIEHFYLFGSTVRVSTAAGARKSGKLVP
jgi:hypothetical protein